MTKDILDDMKIVVENALTTAGGNISEITFDDLSMPHEPKHLPAGLTAVYTFWCPKEEKFLKIGKVGKNSGPRFVSQHYIPSPDRSTLANSLLKDTYMSGKYGLNEGNVGQWIKANTRRIDILIDAKNRFTNELIESALHYRYDPMYEQ